MATLLIKLNGASDDEVAEIHTLLETHEIDFYETDAGRWGVSVVGFWLRDDTQLAQAQQLLAAYQQERSERVREEYAAQVAAGQHDSFLRRLFRQPLAVFFYLLAILAIFYLSLLPFLQLVE